MTIDQRRTEALELATKLVDELAPRTNARGYTDGTIGPSERIGLVLQVADWLLVEPAALGLAAYESTTEGGPTCFKCAGTTGEIVCLDKPPRAGSQWMHALGLCP